MYNTIMKEEVMKDRRHCQDYSKEAARVAATEVSDAVPEIVKGITLLLVFFGLFILASSIACPL